MSSDDFVDDIVPDKLPEHSQPAPGRADFRPWHRVRKEFIRREQWNLLTRRMIVGRWKRELHQPDDAWSLDEPTAEAAVTLDPVAPLLTQPLRCLVLPGEDLLDVRALYRDIDELKCRVKYLGFNESEGSDEVGTRVHISNNEVTSLPNVLRDSMVVRDQFEALASPASMATQYLKRFGPYHVVNLDLCGSIFPNTVKDCTSFYQALTELLRYQCMNQRSEWLLFITTMVQPNVVHSERFNVLGQPMRQNYDQYADFANLITGLIPEAAFPTAPPPPIDTAPLDNGQMIQLFSLAFGKWLLSFCETAQPHWTVAMRRSFTYPMNDAEGAVMLSLAYELKPNLVPPVDPTGMTTQQAAPGNPFPTERDCAMKMIASVDGMRDVAAILAADNALKDQLRDAQARLLEAAGYDPQAYREWVADGEVSAA